MADDLHPAFLGQFAVEVVIQTLDGLVTVHEPGDVRTPGHHRIMSRMVCIIRFLLSHEYASLLAVAGSADKATCTSEFEQRFLQGLSSTVDAAHHRADGYLGDLGDLLVGETMSLIHI